MKPFDFFLRTRVVCGSGTISRLGELVSNVEGSRVLLVTDPGIVATGHVQRGLDSLCAAGLKVTVFDGARENPTTDHVDAGLQVAREFEPDTIVGLGGGSSMDCAKGINFLHTNGGRMQDYRGVGKATKPMLPMVAVPTTAGTGSEMQSFALISDAQTQVKMACGDVKASCVAAILDPELTLTQPETVTALTGIDAISHAIETYVTTKRNPVSRLFSREAWKQLGPNFFKVLSVPNDLEARAAMQIGAAWSGVAIENSMLGAAHALANPLTATFGVPHGQAVGVMLPHVIRFNARTEAAQYRELLQSTDGIPGLPRAESGPEGLADFVSRAVEQAGLKTGLGELDVDPGRISELAVAASKQWTGTFNPVPVDAESLKEIYFAAMKAGVA